MPFTLSIAKSFSTAPAGRYASDGPTSGEVFRINMLRPALIDHKHVIVDLDGTQGYASSFLVGAFLGLNKYQRLVGREWSIEFKSDEDLSLIVEIEEYLKAEPEIRKVAVFPDQGHPWDGRPGFDLMEINADNQTEFDELVAKARAEFWEPWILGKDDLTGRPGGVMYKPSGINEPWEDAPEKPHAGGARPQAVWRSRDSSL